MLEFCIVKNISSYQLLSRELKKRKQKNPSYSLRAFARDLGVGKTTISDVINGDRRLSIQNIELIAKSLKLSNEIVSTLKSELPYKKNTDRDIIEDNDLILIEDWYYLAILNIAKLSATECSGEWIGKRLGLPVEVATLALDFLIERGYIENVDGKLSRKAKLFTTTNDIPSASIVEHHKQTLEIAGNALDDVPVALRDFTTVTYAIDPLQIPEVKDLILNFHRRLGKVLERDVTQEVYRLNIQFFPLTRPIEIQDN